MARRPPDLEGTHSLLVLNISFRTTPEDLRNEFKRFGTLADVYIPRSHGNSRGYAFVRYYNKEEADNARREMDKKTLDNREIGVQIAKYGRNEHAANRHSRRSPPPHNRYRRERSISPRRGGGGPGGPGPGGYHRERYHQRFNSPRRNRSRSPDYKRFRHDYRDDRDGRDGRDERGEHRMRKRDHHRDERDFERHERPREFGRHRDDRDHDRDRNRDRERDRPRDDRDDRDRDRDEHRDERDERIRDGDERKPRDERDDRERDRDEGEFSRGHQPEREHDSDRGRGRDYDRDRDADRHDREVVKDQFDGNHNAPKSEPYAAEDRKPSATISSPVPAALQDRH